MNDFPLNCVNNFKSDFLNSIPIYMIVNYLEKDWVISTHPTQHNRYLKNFFIFSHKFDEFRTINVPTSNKFSDYARRINELLIELAIVENRSALKIAIDIIGYEIKIMKKGGIDENHS